MEGNHEFQCRKSTWPFIQWIEEPYYLLTTDTNQRILLAHGDLLISSWQYQMFRSILNSEILQIFLKIIPPKTLDQFALRFADFSRNKHSKYLLDMKSLVLSAQHLLNTYAATSFVFGHFHKPFSCRVQTDTNTEALLVCMGCWKKPNVLLLEANRCQRLCLHDLKL